MRSKFLFTSGARAIILSTFLKNLILIFSFHLYTTMADRNFGDLISEQTVKDHIRIWQSEDLSGFDYGGFIVGDKPERAVLICKERGIFCGKPFFEGVFSELNCTVTWFIAEGSEVGPLDRIAQVEGKAKDILLGERLALNCITRASGIATAARRLKRIGENRSWHGEVAGTC